MKRAIKPLSRFIACICATLLLILTAACQPTPEAEAVVQKTGLYEKIEAPAQTVFAAPQVWQEQINDESGDIFVDIDAAVTLPDADAFPVIGAKPGAFSQQTVDALVAYFSQGQPLYAADDTMTKAEIEARILDLKQILSEVQNGLEDAGTPQEIQAQIDALSAQWETAPETFENSIADSTLTLDAELNREVLEVTFDSGREERAVIRVINCNDDSYDSSFYYQNGNLYAPDDSLYGKDAEGLSATLDRATQQAQGVLDALGLSDYSITGCETGVCRSNSPADNPEQQGYCVTCKLMIDGMPYLFCEGRDYTGITVDEKTGNYVDEATGEVAEFAPTWEVSNISIYIDDTGVTGFYWSAMAQVQEVKNENVSLLAFEEIQRICAQQMKSEYLYSNEGTVYHIDSIALGFAAVAQENHLGAFWLMPAWTFCGYRENADIPKEAYGMAADTRACFLALNAVDGSVIR